MKNNFFKPLLVKLVIGNSYFSLLLALCFTVFIQFLTGIPNPSYFKEVDQDSIIKKISVEIFDYPFWLQDLSHYPLFFCYAWLWARCFCNTNSFKENRFNLLLVVIALGYAVINEMTQFLVPNRFPSMGDLIMNLLGAYTALVVHRKICINLKKTPKNN